MSDDPVEDALLARLRAQGSSRSQGAGLVQALMRSRVLGTARPRLAHYELLEILGSGGMGVVYGAQDTRSGDRVALKLLHEDQDEHGPAREAAHARLMREGWVASRLQHPNIVRVRERGVHEGRLYLVMDFIEGLPLHRWCERRRPPWRELLRVLLRAGEGLAAAHAAGYVHRDFKPSNVLVDGDSQPHIVDFGLARPMQRSTELTDLDASVEFSITGEGRIIGTAAYLAPELHMGARANASSDQYAYCVTLTKLLEIDVFTRRSALGDVPERLISVVVRGLETLPADRWPSMSQLLAALSSAS